LLVNYRIVLRRYSFTEIVEGGILGDAGSREDFLGLKEMRLSERYRVAVFISQLDEIVSSVFSIRYEKIQYAFLFT